VSLVCDLRVRQGHGGPTILNLLTEHGFAFSVIDLDIAYQRNKHAEVKVIMQNGIVPSQEHLRVFLDNKNMDLVEMAMTMGLKMKSYHWEKACHIKYS